MSQQRVVSLRRRSRGSGWVNARAGSGVGHELSGVRARVACGQDRRDLWEIRASTAASYRCYVELHLLPVFGECSVEEIDRPRCLRFKARLLSDARELRAAIEAGRVLRDERGRRRKPLGPTSIRDVLQVLGAILDEAVEDDLLESNPARGKRVRVRVPKPTRTFLEMDELVLLLQAAGEQDIPLRDAAPQGKLGLTSLRVARLVKKGYRPARKSPGDWRWHLGR